MKVNVAVCCLVWALSSVASARIFTNSAGKTVEAELIRADATNVTLLLKNRRSVTIKISTLSDSDQEFIREWVANRLPEMRIDPNMVRSTKRDKVASAIDERRFISYYNYSQSFDFSIEFDNRDRAKDLEKCLVKYALVGRKIKDKSKYQVMDLQEKTFTVPADSKHTVRFKKVTNDFVQDAHSKASTGFKIIGYVVYAARKKDGRLVYSYGSTPQLDKAVRTIVEMEPGEFSDKVFEKLD